MSHVKIILCPIDFSECAERALDYAARMAKQFNAELRLVHAYTDPLAFVPFSRPNTAGPPTADRAVIESAQRHREKQIRRLQDMCAGHGVDAKVDEKEGEPRRVILDAAKELNADLIIMGTHGRSGAARMLMGSVAERIVRSSPCPVLVVP